MRSQPPLVILLYHQVSANERPRFAEQMDRISRIGDPVPLEDPGALKSGRLRIAVTFDDGIRNVLENAIPELVQRNIHATIFFPTGYLGKPPDWIKNQDSKDESRWVMTVEEAKTLPLDLIGIGSHTVRHKKLNRLSHKEIDSELKDSKTELEKIFERPIQAIAYPYGEYDERVVQASRNAGYSRAYAADPVWVDGYIAGRVHLSPNDWPAEFVLKSIGAYRWLPIAFYLKRLMFSRK